MAPALQALPSGTTLVAPASARRRRRHGGDELAARREASGEEAEANIVPQSTNNRSLVSSSHLFLPAGTVSDAMLLYHHEMPIGKKRENQ